MVVSWANGQAVIRLKNRLFTGDALELMTPGGIVPVTAEAFLRERARSTEIVQTYLIAPEGETARVRRRSVAASSRATKTDQIFV